MAIAKIAKNNQWLHYNKAVLDFGFDDEIDSGGNYSLLS